MLVGSAGRGFAYEQADITNESPRSKMLRRLADRMQRGDGRARVRRSAEGENRTTPESTHHIRSRGRPCEKGDVQDPMRERPGSAVGFVGGLGFHSEMSIGGL